MSVLVKELSQNDVMKQLPIWYPLQLTGVFLRTGAHSAYAGRFHLMGSAYADYAFLYCISFISRTISFQLKEIKMANQ